MKKSVVSTIFGFSLSVFHTAVALAGLDSSHNYARPNLDTAKVMSSKTCSINYQPWGPFGDRQVFVVCDGQSVRGTGDIVAFRDLMSTVNLKIQWLINLGLTLQSTPNQSPIIFVRTESKQDQVIGSTR